MCKFFSVTSDGKGNILYFDWELRKKILNEELNYLPDNHTSINDYFGFKGAKEDYRNAYEYNPLTKKFTIDRINCFDDSKIVEEKVRNLDFSKIVEPLIIKPITNPLEVEIEPCITSREIALLKDWDTVGDSVGGYVWDSVGDSVYAYISSFFNLEKWKYIDHEPFKNPFQSAIDLLVMGLVPSFDGKIWRLHTGQNAKIVYQISKEELDKTEEK